MLYFMLIEDLTRRRVYVYVETIRLNTSKPAVFADGQKSLLTRDFQKW